jgi:AraC family transcriptional activator FtrA
MSAHLVVALAYDQLCTFEYGCVVEIFALPRPELDVEWYRFATCAAEKEPIRATGGLTISTPGSLKLLDLADTIIVPGWRNADETPPEEVLRKIQRAHKRGARLASICSGVFVLAAAGVLSGKTVTTHWRYAEKLAKRYAHIIVQPNALYVDEGQIITSAGSAAGLDMMLHLVRSDYGSKVANLVARRLVIPPHRQGDQAQFVARPVLPDRANGLSSLMEWVRRNLRQPHTLQSLAQRAAMSPRTLQRQFTEAAGLSPYDWVVRERVALASELLESRKATLAQVAEICGFQTEQSLRRHFRRITGVSPSDFRQRFSARHNGANQARL